MVVYKPVRRCATFFILFLLALSIGGCFAKQDQSDEDTISRAFTKRSVGDFVGEYRIAYVRIHVVAVTDSSHSLFKHSRLQLRNDGTYEFIDYPVFRLRAPGDYDFKLEQLAHYTGHWTIEKFGSAYDREKGIRRNFWSCSFVPVPSGERKKFNERLFVDSYVNKKNGLVQYIYFYYGDMDTGDYVLYERIAPAAPHGNQDEVR